MYQFLCIIHLSFILTSWRRQDDLYVMLTILRHWYIKPEIFNQCAIPNYLVRGTDLFFLRLLNKKLTTDNTTIVIYWDWIKIIPMFCHIAKNIFFGVPQNFSNWFMCAVISKGLNSTVLSNQDHIVVKWKDLDLNQSFSHLVSLTIFFCLR